MAISIISDVKLEPTDTAALANELRAARGAGNTAKPTAQASPSPTAPESSEPRRFAGKSREDIMEMYLNLEKHDGRLANENGQMQRALQELLVDKRARDLAANGGGPKPSAKVEPADLLQRPTEALDPFIEERVNRAITPIQQQLSQLEGLLRQSVFQGHHRDAHDVLSSAEFAEWTRETPLRRNMAQMAANGNTQAADDLLTEFKETRAAQATRETTQEQSRLSEAGRVSLEQSRTGNDGTASRQQRKDYTRSQMVALMQSPAYQNDESLREEVSRAYIEGRVR